MISFSTLKTLIFGFLELYYCNFPVLKISHCSFHTFNRYLIYLIYQSHLFHLELKYELYTLQCHCQKYLKKS